MKIYIYLGIIILFISSCQNQKTDASEIRNTQNFSGTEQMIDSINGIIAKTNFRNHLYESGEKVKLIAQEVNTAYAQGKLSAELLVEFAEELLNAGQTQKAIKIFEEIAKNYFFNE